MKYDQKSLEFKISVVDPHFGSTFFLNLLQLIWPDGAFLGGHVSIPDWLSWNQNSVFESQSEIDTWQGGIYKSCRLLRSRPAGEERFFWLEGGVLFGRGFFRQVQGVFPGQRELEEEEPERRGVVFVGFSIREEAAEIFLGGALGRELPGGGFSSF